MSGTSPASNYVTVEEGVRLYCEEWGSGEGVLLFPNGIPLMEDFRRFAAGRRVIAYDVRNRGCSDTISDAGKLARGILNDVDDLEALRRHLGVDRIDLIAHSYMGLMVILYAIQYPEHVNRIVQIGAIPPRADAQYPPHLSGDDGLLAEVFQKIGQLQKELAGKDPAAACRQFWELLRVIYVADPACAPRLNWMRCELPNERNSLAYWNGVIFPSIRKLHLTAEDLGKATAPVLGIHGVRDRSAPYGGGREWAMRLPNARLVTVPNAAHAPWIEAPEMVFAAIDAFLEGGWPVAAERVTAVDPQAG